MQEIKQAAELYLRAKYQKSKQNYIWQQIFAEKFPATALRRKMAECLQEEL